MMKIKLKNTLTNDECPGAYMGVGPHGLDHYCVWLDDELVLVQFQRESLSSGHWERIDAHRRLTKDEYAMSFAVLAAQRSTCDRLRVGCAIFDAEGHVLSTGYNGSAPGQPHCDDVGHLMIDGGCKRTVHAEQNAVGHAARIGVSLSGSTAYVTNHPCIDCAKLLAAAGVSRVVYLAPYRDATDDAAEAVAQPMTFEWYTGRILW